MTKEQLQKAWDDAKRLNKTLSKQVSNLKEELADVKDKADTEHRCLSAALSRVTDVEQESVYYQKLLIKEQKLAHELMRYHLED